MDTEKIFEKLSLHFDLENISGIKDILNQLLQELKPEDATRFIADAIGPRYKSYFSERFMYILKVLFEDNKKVISDPKAHFPIFEMILITGSVDMYEIFIQHIVTPYLNGKDELVVDEYYIDLYGFAEEGVNAIQDDYQQVKRGTHYIGEIGNVPGDPNVLMITYEDYEAMEKVVEAFNAVVGRRDIIKDLEMRMTEP